MNNYIGSENNSQQLGCGRFAQKNNFPVNHFNQPFFFNAVSYSKNEEGRFQIYHPKIIDI